MHVAQNIKKFNIYINEEGFRYNIFYVFYIPTYCLLVFCLYISCYVCVQLKKNSVGELAVLMSQDSGGQNISNENSNMQLLKWHKIQIKEMTPLSTRSPTFLPGEDKAQGTGIHINSLQVTWGKRSEISIPLHLQKVGGSFCCILGIKIRKFY